MSSYLYDRSRRGLTLLTPPQAEPVSLQTAKRHLRVDIEDDDDYIRSIIAAARDWVEKYTRRALYKQTWQLTLDRFPTWGDTDDPYFWLYRRGIIELVVPPLMSVDAVEYLDPGGGQNILYSALSIPSLLPFTLGAGTLTQGVYSYRVAAISAAGSTLASARQAIVVPAANPDPYGVNVNWRPVPNAIGYYIYGRTSGSEQLLATVGPVTTWLDSGANAPSGSVPTADTSGFFTTDIQDDFIRMEPVYGQYWPITQFRISTVKVTYSVGYTDGIVAGRNEGLPMDGDPANKIPAPIKHAILLLTDHFYENRELMNAFIGSGGGPLAFGIEDLLGPFRSIRF